MNDSFMLKDIGKLGCFFHCEELKVICDLAHEHRLVLKTIRSEDVSSTRLLPLSNILLCYLGSTVITR